MSTEPPLSRHLSGLVAEYAARTPDALAVADGEELRTYAQLDELISSWAAGLSRLGLERGGTLGLLCTNRIEWLACALGAHRLGARVATFNTFAKAWDLEHMLAHSQASVLVCVQRFRSRDYRETLAELLPELKDREWRAERFPQLRHVVLLGDEPSPAGALSQDDVLGAGPAALPDGATSPDDDAFVLYTSGSSARPKAVPLVHRALIENGFDIGERMELTGADRVFVSVPLFWAYGAVNALPATLTHGGALVLQEAFEASGALDLIERHRCTAIYTLPNMTAALISADGFDRARVASLRTGLTIGTPSDLRSVIDGLGVDGICNIYGGTETYGNCCVTPTSWSRERRELSQGPPLPGMRLRIVDPESGTELPAGAIGEIHVSGYLARGYLDDDTDASAAFGADGWFHSGDLGALDEEGALTFSTRATEMIKTAGINVAPREVEEFLALHPSVRIAAVVGVADERITEAVVAFVVPQAGASVTAQELRAFCAERIAMFKVPARIHVVDELPTTDTGKLARARLVELDMQEGEITA
ncbi:unannotated protein [freshwater metagenome]|uniref:Unannotated protein n=1 Tax=freshwater metagenome TaxID=449393 RepID=A0A6J7D5A6_9ZZZZ